MTMDEIRGVDCSHWHPVTNWGILAQHARFIGIKATESLTGVDPTLGIHRGGFRASTLDLAIYFHVGRMGDPVAQARHFVEKVGPLEPHECLCLDLERDAGIRSTDWLDAFYGEIMGGACGPNRTLIYVSNGGWRDNFANATWDLASEIDLWIPRYGPELGDLPRPWSKWALWQFSESAATPGISPPNDLNRFNGTAEEWAVFAGLAPLAA